MTSLIRTLFAAATLVAAGLASSPAQAQDITVVQVAPFSGTQAVSGRGISAGIKLYFDHVNRQGGVNGRRLKLVTRDDEQKPDLTLKQIKQALDEDSPTAFIATVGTGPLEAVIKDGVLAKAGVPMIGAVSGAESVVNAPELFVTKASYRDEIETLFTQIKRLGVNRIGIVYQNNGFGTDILASADAMAKKTGVTIVARAAYEPNTVKVEGAVAAMAKADVQLVLLGAVTNPAAEFMKQYRAAGGFAQVYGLSIVDTEALLKNIGPERARGFALTEVFPNRSVVPLIREYNDLRSKATGIEGLSGRSLEGFVAAKALVNALRRADTVSGPAVARAMRRNVDLGGYELSFSGRGGAGSDFVDFAMIGAGGKLVR